jgi:hypothetical protein
MVIENYRIELSALKDAPVYEHRRHGKNWLAVISLSDTAPGGIAREFIPGASGGYLYFVKGLMPGQAVEFGADYCQTPTRRYKNRAYGVIQSISVGRLVLLRTENAAAAIALAESLAKETDKNPA